MVKRPSNVSQPKNYLLKDLLTKNTGRPVSVYGKTKKNNIPEETVCSIDAFEDNTVLASIQRVINAIN